MPGFKSGPVPTPDYESNNNINQYSDVTEFIDDVYIYGTLYADISASDIDFGDSVNFKNVSNLNNLKSNISKHNIKLEYLEIRNKFTLRKKYNKNNFKIFLAYYNNNVRLIDNF